MVREAPKTSAIVGRKSIVEVDALGPRDREALVDHQLLQRIEPRIGDPADLGAGDRR